MACTQEAALFDEVADEAERTAPIAYVNIRETAGWSREGAQAGPKMAALLAAAAEPMPAVPVASLESEGVVLVYGRDEAPWRPPACSRTTSTSPCSSSRRPPSSRRAAPSSPSCAAS